MGRVEERLPPSGPAPGPGVTDLFAIDWSGRASGERHRIWLAQAREGRLVRLESGRTRRELVDHLVGTGRSVDRMVVGLDFAFSFPGWFLQERGLRSAPELWALARAEGEAWLRGCPAPFWGRPGQRRPDLPEHCAHFRGTERPAVPDPGIKAKSPFQIGGAGAVGTGTVRGMPFLLQLHDEGFCVWPFDRPAWPLVVEIYPRLLTGPVRKSDRRAREDYLDSAPWTLPAELQDKAGASEDAFDAAVSALVMSEHAEEFDHLTPASDPQVALEGCIWRPSRPSG